MRRLVNLRIILILYCGNEFFKQVVNFCFKLDTIVPRYGSIIFSEHKVCLKKVLWIVV